MPSAARASPSVPCTPPWATTVTPATAVHSHHNGGAQRAMFLIVQDGGLYYHTRALGFAFEDGA